ncbi:DNA primase family protein [Roseateles sp. PN1]|uniref:DNA primase family protein n=1 Tax=Roseateles sp. PN1 TaxID=3137372 RepID=UPI00313A38CD
MLTKEYKEINSESEIIFSPFDDDDLIPRATGASVPASVIAKAANMLAASNSKKKKKNDIATELKYSRIIQADEDTAVLAQEEAVYMYRWTGTHWASISEHDAKKLAMNWLTLMAPDEANDRMAGACYRTALLTARSLPAKPTATVIPFKDNWLEVKEDGSFVVIKPNKKMGITYEIAAYLNHRVGPYVPKAVPESSRLFKFLNSSLPNKDKQELVQEYSGYTLIPDTRFQKCLVNTGEGSNGKSVLISIVSALHQKVAAMRLDKLDGFGTYSLKDASLAVSAEAPKKGINEEVLKSCISGDVVTLEGKFKNQFEYAPTAKWLVSCNRFPKIEDESNGVWRRVMIVEWDVVIAENSPDIILDLQKLIIRDELIHVVNWCLLGLQRLLRRKKFDIPDVVKSSTIKEKELSNSVLPFVADSMLEESAVSIQKDEVYGRYKAYCETSGFMPYGNAEFWRRLKARFPSMKEERKRVGGEFKRYVFLSFQGELEEALDQSKKVEPPAVKPVPAEDFDRQINSWKLSRNQKEELEVF